MAPPRLRRRAPALAGAVAVAVVVALKLVAPLHDGTPSQGPGPSFAGLSAGAWARGPGRAGRRPAQRAAEPDEKEKALNILAQAEANEDAVAAAEIAMQDDVADSIVQEAVYAPTDDKELELQAQAMAELKEMQDAEARGEGIIESLEVVDLETLCAKYGGCQKVSEDHQVAADGGYFEAMPQLKRYLFEGIQDHIDTVKDSFVEFVQGDSRLVLVGTNHMSRSSADFSREVVRKEKPDCLVLERRMGDDSLQRLTIPEDVYQQKVMGKAPSVLLERDTPVDRARKFQQDRVWVESTPGWKDIGSECVFGHEYGAAFEEFASQEGGTLVFGDSDLRDINPRTDYQRQLPPSVEEMSLGACMPLRDLQLAASLRLAMQTHKTVVGIVGKDHLNGITKLLTQDPKITVSKEGIPTLSPEWQKDVNKEGAAWERAAASGVATMFYRIMEASDWSPYGTWIDGKGVKELSALRQETAKRLQELGPEAASPAAPVSSALADDLFGRKLAYTPKTKADFQKWRSGQAKAQYAGEFPFENRRLRKQAPPMPSSGFADD